jgi:hypothetical protein
MITHKASQDRERSGHPLSPGLNCISVSNKPENVLPAIMISASMLVIVPLALVRVIISCPIFTSSEDIFRV